DLLVRDCGDRCDAGARGLAIDVDGAGATERHATAELGPGQADLVSQRPQQRRLSWHVDALPLAVDLELNHRGSPLVIEPSRAVAPQTPSPRRNGITLRREHKDRAS